MKTNGSMERIEEKLQEEATVGYVPQIPLETLWLGGAGDLPQITLRRDIEFMQMHPIVANALEYYKSGISGVKFWGGPDYANPDNRAGKPVSPDPRVAAFVLAQVDRFWDRAVPLLQDGAYPYGWAAGEHIYKEVNGLMMWHHMKPFHPNDAFVLSVKHQPVGVRIKNVKDKNPVDLWYASESIPAKAAWYPHKPRFNQLYGRSQLIGAWRPWRRLGWRDGFEQVLDAAVYRAGYRGPIVKHPLEDMQTAQSGIPATKADAAGRPRRSARDVARQIVEWAKAGAGFTLSSANYPPTQGGGPKWSIEWPDHVMDIRPLIEGARYLEDQVMLGIGTPPELIRAGGTGSGYSGRSIPLEAFLQGQQRIANSMLNMFVEQVIRPLVLWNFGVIPFEVQCRSLLETRFEAKQPTEGGSGADKGPVNLARSQAAKDAWAKRKVNQPAPASPAALSLEMREKVLSIVKRIVEKKAS